MPLNADCVDCQREIKDIVIEKQLDEKLECHSCGRIAKGRVMIWLKHLCQHFVALCRPCLAKLKKELNAVS